MEVKEDHRVLVHSVCVHVPCGEGTKDGGVFLLVSLSLPFLQVSSR